MYPKVRNGNLVKYSLLLGALSKEVVWLVLSAVCSQVFPVQPGRPGVLTGSTIFGDHLLVPGTLPGKATGWSLAEFLVVVAQWPHHPWVLKGHCQVLF